MPSRWLVVFSKCAAISLSGPAMPPPAMTWSSAATEDSATQNVEPATRIALHAFIFSSLLQDLAFEFAFRESSHNTLTLSDLRLAAHDLAVQGQRQAVAAREHSVVPETGEARARDVQPAADVAKVLRGGASEAYGEVREVLAQVAQPLGRVNQPARQGIDVLHGVFEPTRGLP